MTDDDLIDSHGLKAMVLSSSLRGFTLISGINAGVFSLGIKSIRGVVKEELELVKEALQEHTKKLDALWDQAVEITEDITEIKVTLKSNAVDLDHTKKRVSAVEDHLGI